MDTNSMVLLLSLMGSLTAVTVNSLAQHSASADYDREFAAAQKNHGDSVFLRAVTSSHNASLPRPPSRRMRLESSTFTPLTTTKAKLNLDFTNCAVFLIYMIINSSGKVAPKSVEMIQYKLAERAQTIGGPRNNDSDVFEHEGEISVKGGLVMYIIECFGEIFALLCFTRTYQDSFFFLA
jgi:hypothetical protein